MTAVPSRTTERDGENTIHITMDDMPPPPYSETDIYSNSGDPRSPNPASSGRPAASSDSVSRISSSSTGEVILTPPETPRIPTSPQQPAVAHYFSTRPPPPDAPDGTIEHALDVRDGSVPDDFPYRAEFAQRDVSAQDWATFVNFLIPDHAARGNEAVIDRKLRAEEDSETHRSSSGRSHAELQLEGLRERPVDPPEAAQRRGEVEATVRQWNDEFFVPRGINVRLLPASSPGRMPGSWDSTFDPSPSTAEAGPSAPPQPGRQGGVLSRFQMDENGIRYGDKFVMDANQMRLGNLVLDARGIRLDQPGEASRSFGEHAASRGYPGHPGMHHFNMGPVIRGQAWDERGRQPQTTGLTQPRDPSPSSLSVSSDDSYSSESSIGSLPSYDDLPDQQLPLYMTRLEAWIARPDEMRTKGDIRQLKTELRGANTDLAASPYSSQSKAELRSKAKVLSQHWKQVKKEQRRLRRERRKEQRQRKRAEKKERRQRRKEMRKAENDLRRGRVQPAIPVEPRTHAGIAPFTTPTTPQGPMAPQGISVPSIPPPSNVPYIPPIPSPWGSSRHCRTNYGRGFFGGQPCASPPAPFGGHGPFGRGAHRGRRGHCGHGSFLGRDGIFGPCSRAAPPAGDPSRAPGAWPGDSNRDVDNDAAPPPGPASAGMYRTVNELETQVAQKRATAAQARNPTQRAAVEMEVEALAATLEQIRMTADEAYARELATVGARY